MDDCSKDFEVVDGRWLDSDLDLDQAKFFLAALLFYDSFDAILLLNVLHEIEAYIIVKFGQMFVFNIY
jgi:hypothetical protein